jgi:hypothetical protein
MSSISTIVSQSMMLIKITSRSGLRIFLPCEWHSDSISFVSFDIKVYCFHIQQIKAELTSNVEASDLLFYAFSISRMTILTQIHAQTLIQVNEAQKWENKGRKMSSLASSELSIHASVEVVRRTTTRTIGESSIFTFLVRAHNNQIKEPQ